MASTIKLADYLLTRLKQLGIGSIHGVPGDYNLTLLDYVEPAGLRWVGSANELNAGYAADGYARVKGFGALITTYGVGELSAINAIAGAFTERAAVVHIVGTPPRVSQDNRIMIHHTLGDGDYRHFGQMASHVTAAQTNLLDPRTAAEQIDEAIRQCILHNRPVYIEVPVDMVSVLLPADRLQQSITVSEVVSEEELNSAVKRALDRIHDAKQPMILVDGETRALGLAERVRELVKSTQWPTFSSSSGKDVVDNTLPNFYGIYQGRFADQKTRDFVEGSDLILCFGPHFSTTNTYALTSIPKPENTIAFTSTGIRFGTDLVRILPARRVLDEVLGKIDGSRITNFSKGLDLARDYKLSYTDVGSEENIKQDKAWRVLSNFLRPGDIVFGETGTAGYAVREMALPQNTRLFAPITWLSIGYMLPASQGAALAQSELQKAGEYHGLDQARTILVIGDGSFQMTCQELATMIRLKLNVVVFLLNNDGYTIERCIHGIYQKYNDISPWRYLKSLSLFGAPEDSFTGSAKTYGELQKALTNPKLADSQGVRMLEIFMDRFDAPTGILLDMINKQKQLANGGH